MKTIKHYSSFIFPALIFACIATAIIIFWVNYSSILLSQTGTF